MSRLIADILQSPEPHFSHTLREWELKAGQPGHDSRLISDVAVRRRKALRSLGLDEVDTTGQELYYALRHKAAEANTLFEKKIGVNDQASPRVVMERIIAFVDQLAINRDIWVVKHAAIKATLKKNPPKRLLKTLGLRSIDSVLKRSNACELLALAHQIESTEWTKRLHKQYRSLHPTDFQTTKSSLYLLEDKKAQKLYRGGYARSKLIIPNYETGTILLLVPGRRFAHDTLVLTLAILQALYDVRVYSAYFRYTSVRPDFNQAFLAAMQSGLPGGLYKNKIGWRVLQRHFTMQPESFDSVEQPHFQYDDIKLEYPLDVLVPLLDVDFDWQDSAGVFLVAPDEAPVSMHLMDVLFNASNDVPFDAGRTAHLRSSMWEDLALRYLEHAAIREATLATLDALEASKE